jgi:two-component system, NtrC family, sensor histidine kinase HydH
MMNTREGSFLVAAAGHLALLVLVLRLGRKNPLMQPTALLSAALFAIMTVAFVNRLALSALSIGEALDPAITAIAPALVLNFVLTLVGKSRKHQRWLRIASIVFGSFSMLSFVHALYRGSEHQSVWQGVFLLLWIPTFGFAIRLLVVHAQDARAEERSRAQLALLGLLLGGTLASTDAFRDAGAPIIDLAPFGLLFVAGILACIVVRFRAFEEDASRTLWMYGLSVVAGCACIYSAGARFGIPLLVIVLAVTGLILGLSQRASKRTEQLAFLGRMSAQMSHDLKNPLAALLGAVHVLEGSETEQESEEMRRLVVEQAERMRSIVDQYDRAGRVEPLLSIVDVNARLERIVAPYKVRLELDAALSECEIDPDLFASAIENLLANAQRAMQGQANGTITVTTLKDEDVAVVSVHDNGPGMEAMHAEQVWDDFVSTKAPGGGLGLAFVRRVAEAHGGDAALTSKKGIGTTVTLRLPIGTKT